MHAPVLLEETIAALNLHEGDFVIDGTLGGGGHAKEILRRIGPRGRLLGVDADADALARAKRALANSANAIFVHDSYAALPAILERQKLPKTDGLLLDLGLSSDQLEAGGRGFSFQRDELLDMRYDTRCGITAAKLVAGASVAELSRIFREHGEEPNAAKYAHAIVLARRKQPIRTSGALAEVVARAGGTRKGKIHPATKVFMALRIAVNHELENVRTTIARLPEIVRSGGRVVVITFHSLEDRFVKEGFKTLAKSGRAKLLTKHVVKPSRAEILANPRSRSAKLRALQML
ncbi:MAG: 16S rRNA (cytosine(1402)-N(4))-methyltransferase RsmH [Candidatus Brennerbacteria bacterium]|nr:16S rRNA (cytosine(1402)-N(4))-methyltransferase RsmH [Candidatus Brennerbacteria bacterium]